LGTGEFTGVVTLGTDDLAGEDVGDVTLGTGDFEVAGG
jgi:hypothetical protein